MHLECIFIKRINFPFHQVKTTMPPRGWHSDLSFPVGGRIMDFTLVSKDIDGVNFRNILLPNNSINM